MSSDAMNKIFKEYEQNKGSLIPLLQKIQDEYGYLPQDVLKELAKYLDVPISKIFGVATFYAQFYFTPLGKNVIKICHGTACHVNGSVNISQALREELGINEGETSKDGFITLIPVACLGCCSLAPCLMINEKVYGKLTPDEVRKIAKKLLKGELE